MTEVKRSCVSGKEWDQVTGIYLIYLYQSLRVTSVNIFNVLIGIIGDLDHLKMASSL